MSTTSGDQVGKTVGFDIAGDDNGQIAVGDNNSIVHADAGALAILELGAPVTGERLGTALGIADGQAVLDRLTAHGLLGECLPVRPRFG